MAYVDKSYPGFGHHGTKTEQRYTGYTADEQGRWRQLVARQIKLMATHAPPEFASGLTLLPEDGSIPRIAELSDRLQARSGWRLVPVTGLIAHRDFFTLIADRTFPVSCHLRRPEEMEFYMAEPDIFRDCFGHVPMLAHAPFADFMQAYGTAGLAARDDDEAMLLARLYWYTAEFGLINLVSLRALGGGLLSAPGETDYALHSPRPLRLAFDLERVMRTDFHVGDVQNIYFVTQGYAALRATLAGDLPALFKRHAGRLPIPPGQTVDGDTVLDLAEL